MGPASDRSDQHRVHGRTDARSRRIRHGPNTRDRHRCPEGIQQDSGLCRRGEAGSEGIPTYHIPRHGRGSDHLVAAFDARPNP
eukprot:1807618-Pleurochrysis_carterae.AAC.1